MAFIPGGWHPPAQKPSYATYRSPYGPKYRTLRNFRGISIRGATRLVATGASFAGVAGIFALYFFSEVPKVRKDIMQRLPVIGDYWVQEVPPSDNPF